MLQCLLKHSTWRLTLVLLALNFALQALILLGSYPACCGTQIPLDISFLLPPSAVYAFLNAIGEEGRQLYLINELSLDIAFPIFYAAAYSCLLAQLLKHNQLQHSRYLVGLYLPLAIACADLFENLHISALLITYPQPSVYLLQGLSVSNFLKHALSLLTFSFLVILLLRPLILRVSPAVLPAKPDA